ncbi:hypothetical protein N7540_011753 [Penicillium herquei]|nr:hypothetical protein N7540_011753 [Penicillium herquei]
MSVTYESDTASDERPSSHSHSKIQATFQIARPPPKSSLRIAPKLLLQIQQLAPNHRPVPVLEIWQPPFRKSKLTRDFPQRPKLRSGDIYASTNEPYILNPNAVRKDSTRSDSDDDAQHKDIVAAMCHTSPPTCGSVPEEGSSHIYFRDSQCSWVASAGTIRANKTPCYRFMLKDDSGRMTIQCERRDTEKEGEEEFILFLIDRTARRKSRIATMSPGWMEILVRKGSILESLQICMELMGPVGAQESGYALEKWLYTQVLTLGTWVAQQEGWHGLNP